MSRFFLNFHMVSFPPSCHTTSSKLTANIKFCNDVVMRPPTRWIAPLDCKQLSPTAETNRSDPSLHQNISASDMVSQTCFVKRQVFFFIFHMCMTFNFCQLIITMRQQPTLQSHSLYCYKFNFATHFIYNINHRFMLLKPKDGNVCNQVYFMQ